MKKILALLLAAVLVLGMAACAASPAAPSQTTSDTASDASDTPASNAETPAASSGAKLRFVTGGESGTYYAFGSVIAQHATNNAGVDIVGLVGNGSQSNIFELEDGNAELAFCQSDVMAYAYDGTNLFADTGAVSCFSTVAALYTEQVQIVTTDPEIKSVDDLKGKNVSIGAAYAGVGICHPGHGVALAVHLSRHAQHIARTRSDAHSASFAAFLIDNDCSFYFSHKP